MNYESEIVVTLPLCRGEAGVPTAVLPFNGERPSRDVIKKDALEVIRARGVMHHEKDLLPDAGLTAAEQDEFWSLRWVAPYRYELHPKSEIAAPAHP